MFIHGLKYLQRQKEIAYVIEKKGRERKDRKSRIVFSLDTEMMPPGGSTKAEKYTKIAHSSFAWSGAPHTSPPLLLPFLPTLFLAASGRGQDGRESTENREGEGQRHRGLLTQTEHPDMEFPLIPHLFLPLMFLTGEGG